MNRNATAFSPGVTNANGNLSVVPYNATNGINGSSANGHADSPHDHIVHESLKHLIQEVQELRARCTNLEDENADLRSSIYSLEQVFSTSLHHAPRVNANLTGYSSSGSSSAEEPKVGINAGMEATNQRVDEHVTIVNEILESFRDHLMKEIEERKTLEKQLNDFRRDYTTVKGRVGSTESKLKTMRNDMDELEVAHSDRRLDSHFVAPEKSTDGMAAYLQDKVEHIQGELNMALMDVRELHNDVKAQGAAVNELQMIVTANDKDTTTGWTTRVDSNSSNGKDESSGQYSSMKSTIDKLTATVKAMTKKAEQEQKIDDAAMQESLHIMYKQLDHDIYADKRIGPFEGNTDELWALRDRVVRRLALFDKYAVALQEARKADVDLGRV